jgi:hypothetical protein
MMRSRPPLAAVDGEPPDHRREPTLGTHDAPAPRVVARQGGRNATTRLDLHAGERVVVASDDAGSEGGGAAAIIKKIAFVALALLALVGAATLLRPLVGL